MGMTKKIRIDGKEVLFKASAAIPRIYRLKFHRDIYKDLRDLEKAVGDSDEKESSLDLLSIGLVNDMYAESGNDGYKYRELANQEDFDSF